MTLRDSLAAVAPDTPFYVFLADKPLDVDAPCEKIVCAAELSLPDLADMSYRYSVMEFSTAIKPFCF